MKKFSVFFLFLSISCQSISFTPIESESVTIIYDRSHEIGTYESIAVDFEVLMNLDRHYNKELCMQVVIKNNLDEEVLLKDSDFVLLSSNDGQKWKKIALYSSKKFYQKNESAILFLSSMSAFSQQQYSNPIANELARLNNQREYLAMAISFSDWLGFLKQNLFYTKSLKANEIYSGLFFGKYKKAKYYKIVLDKKDTCYIEVPFVVGS